MGLYHAIIGIVEGAITAGAIYLLLQARPEFSETVTGVSGA